MGKIRKPIKHLRYAGDEEFISWSGLEPGVRDIVKDLNYHGYGTSVSCDGGLGHGDPVGYIGLQEVDFTPDEREEIISIVEFHTDIPFRLKKGTIVFSRPLSGPYLGLEAWKKATGNTSTLGLEEEDVLEAYEME